MSFTMTTCSPKYEDNLKLCQMDTDNFIYCIEIEDWYADIAPDVEDRFNTSAHDPSKPLPTGFNKKVVVYDEG